MSLPQSAAPECCVLQDAHKPIRTICKVQLYALGWIKCRLLSDQEPKARG